MSPPRPGRREPVTADAVPRTASSTAKTLGRMTAVAAYLGLARHLPWSPRPGGAASRRIRGRLARLMLDECGEDVNVEHGAWFGSGRGIRLGDRSDIGMDALVIGPLHIGRDVMMGPRCILLASSHAFGSVDVPMNRQGFLDDRPIVIEDDVWVGAGSIVLPGVRIGTGSIVGAGSVVTRDVPPRTVVAGNPARAVRSRSGDAATAPSELLDPAADGGGS
jgi:maltose O-acetyltransferase